VWSQFTWLCVIPLFRAHRIIQSLSKVQGARVDFKQFLHNNAAQKVFTEHLANEWAIENIKFWNQVETYRDHSFKSVKQSNLVALQTLKTFIKAGSVLEVNIQAKVRDLIVDSFDKHSVQDPDFDKVKIDQHIFDEAQAEVFLLMEKDSFQRFQLTEAYKTFAANQMAIDPSKGVLVVVSDVA